MPAPVSITLIASDAAEALREQGRIALILAPGGRLSGVASRLDRSTRGAIRRALAGDAWDKLKVGEALDLAYPAGLEAKALQLVKLPARASSAEARKAGSAVARGLGEAGALVAAGSHARAAEIAFGLTLRAYAFNIYKTGDDVKVPGPVRMMHDAPERIAPEVATLAAVADGVAFTRDLVNEPANVLTTTDFAERLAAMRGLGLKVDVLEEGDLARLGMRALLGVGQGSTSPSKVVVMEWNGGAKGDAPFALVGKGVVFDSGGISIKPAAGMEEMTMDMGGAGVVAGVMRTLALRKARANVVGLVGLVENMPDGGAQRPGDVVRSMKGDTIEIINTDAEGRLVLADVLWYAQQRFHPQGMINLATLTGAIIIALGNENAGVFANDDGLADRVLKAAAAEGEGAWRMPLSPAYDALLKSHIADMRNTGGRPGGSISAAQFLKRFVGDDVPWCHIDIAGVAVSVGEQPLVRAKCATGWGVMTLNRLIHDMIEK